MLILYVSFTKRKEVGNKIKEKQGASIFGCF